MIPRKQELAIYDYIYLTVMVEMLEGKTAKGINLDEPIRTVLKELAIVKNFMRQNYIRVHDPIVDEDRLFVTFKYTIKVNGGYREGFHKFWRSALVMIINKKLKQMQKGETIIEFATYTG